VVVLGDRFETLAAAISAFLLKIPIIHIHGGEITEGAVDDGIRPRRDKDEHASFHFNRRVQETRHTDGEQPSRVFNVGSLGVENIGKLKLNSRKETYGYLGIPLYKNYVLVTFHPVTLASDGGVSPV